MDGMREIWILLSMASLNLDYWPGDRANVMAGECLNLFIGISIIVPSVESDALLLVPKLSGVAV